MMRDARKRGQNAVARFLISLNRRLFTSIDGEERALSIANSATDGDSARV